MKVYIKETPSVSPSMGRKSYSTPAVRIVAIEATALLSGSETVEFRFNTRVNNEWEDTDEHYME